MPVGIVWRKRKLIGGSLSFRVWFLRGIFRNCTVCLFADLLRARQLANAKTLPCTLASFASHSPQLLVLSILLGAYNNVVGAAWWRHYIRQLGFGSVLSQHAGCFWSPGQEHSECFSTFLDWLQCGGWSGELVRRPIYAG